MVPGNDCSRNVRIQRYGIRSRRHRQRNSARQLKDALLEALKSVVCQEKHPGLIMSFESDQAGFRSLIAECEEGKT